MSGGFSKPSHKKLEIKVRCFPKGIHKWHDKLCDHTRSLEFFEIGLDVVCMTENKVFYETDLLSKCLYGVGNLAQ